MNHITGVRAWTAGQAGQARNDKSGMTHKPDGDQLPHAVGLHVLALAAQ